MTERELSRAAARRLAIIRHAEEVTGNIALTCRYCGHHVAEFQALIEGLRMAKRHGVDKIRVFTDSELVVRSVLDDIRLRSSEHRELRDQAQELYSSFTDRKLSRVPREMNAEADLLASAALPIRPTRG